MTSPLTLVNGKPLPKAILVTPNPFNVLQSSYLDYSQIQGFTEIEYGSDRKSALLTVKVFAKDPRAIVQCKFGNNDFGDLVYSASSKTDKDALPSKCKIVNTDITLTLDGTSNNLPT